MIRVLILLMLAVTLAVTATVADTIDDQSEVVSLYARGKRLMRESNWLEASRVFEELAGRFPGSPNLDLFIYNRAKADYHFGDYPKSRAGFTNFIARFPQSSMVGHALFFLGNIEYIRGNLDIAVAHYIDAYARTKDPRLTDLCSASLKTALSNASSVQLSPSDFNAVKGNRRCDLMESLAEVLLAREQFSTARRLLADCGRTMDPAADTMASLTRSFEVAVVLPFSGELQPFAENIYNGAVIAAESYRAESGRPIKLLPYDTKGDPVGAARIMSQLAGGTTDLIIGPLTSEEAAVASAALSCYDVPMIAPAATQAGLTRLCESAFQLSPNVELQGLEMAEYAIKTLQADSAAVITSTTAEHLLMARAFTRRFTELGGEVIAVQYYRPRDKDFGPYVRDIKGLMLGVQPDSVYFVDERGDTVDFDVVPVSLDCLYLPGTASQLRLLLPQVHFYNLSATLLGSDGWGDDAVYRLDERITGNSVFPSPFLEGERSEEYLRFAAAYDGRYGEAPNRLARLGYDAVRLATTAISQGATSRDRLVEVLSGITDYKGASGTITFGLSRENIAMPLYNVENGGARFIGIGDHTEYFAPSE